MSYQVTLLPGDGIGPEVTTAVKECMTALDAGIEWDAFELNEASIRASGESVPAEVLESIRRNGIALKGPITTPVGSGFRSVNVFLRQALDLFACVRPIRYFPGTQSKATDIDLVIFRENTEDLYAGIEFEQGTETAGEVIRFLNRVSERRIREDAAVSIKPISVFGSRRIARAAFEYAVKNGRKKVTIVHKANIMKFSDGLFLREAREVAREFDGAVVCEDLIVDNMCMQLVQRPQDYDVLVLPNLYGDIVSDLCAGLVGGLGMAPGANIGESAALFEPVHGSAPMIAGQNLANPTAALLSSVLMLRHLGETAKAQRLEQAVADVIAEGRYVTADLKSGDASDAAVGTREMTQAIIARLG